MRNNTLHYTGNWEWRVGLVHAIEELRRRGDGVDFNGTSVYHCQRECRFEFEVPTIFLLGRLFLISCYLAYCDRENREDYYIDILRMGNFCNIVWSWSDVVYQRYYDCPVGMMGFDIL